MLKAKAGDNLGGSTSVSITVNVANDVPPSANLTSPSTGAEYYYADPDTSAPVPLAATALDSDGTITKVEFYQAGGTYIGMDTTLPYTFTWDTGEGAYTIYARAYDNDNVASSPAPVSFTVYQSVCGTGDEECDFPGITKTCADWGGPICYGAAPVVCNQACRLQQSCTGTCNP